MLDSSSFRDQMFAHGLLIETGVDGLYGRGFDFEDVIARFSGLISTFAAEDTAEALHFPPGMNRDFFERSGYLKSFPQLAGTIHAFAGNERDHAALLAELEAGEDWTGKQKTTDVVLTPAACYPLYPTVARQGRLPPGGRLFDLQSYCFRREPSLDPARMQMFRMREYVRIGTSADVLDFRETWLARGQKLAERLELPFTVDVANDPFFGRAGKLLANNQRDQKLKFELLVPIELSERPTACLSFNYHQDHFGTVWSIVTDDGQTAHTACVGFGMERVALALFKHHGFSVAGWPASLRKTLWG